MSTSQIPLPFAFPPVCYDFNHLIVLSCFSSFYAFIESHTFAVFRYVLRHILHFTACTTIQKLSVMSLPTSSTSSQHVTPFAHFTNYIDSLLLTAFRGRSQFFSTIYCFYAAFVLYVSNVFPRLAASHCFSRPFTTFLNGLRFLRCLRPLRF